MLYDTRTQYDPVPPETVTTFIDTVRALVPAFDEQAARRAFLNADTLYEFSLPLSLDEYRGLADNLSIALELAGVPAGPGLSTGASPQPFIVFRNFVRED